MTVKYQKVWNTMNDLEMVTSKICSAREIIDNAVDKIQGNEYDKAELLMTAAYEFLEYYLKDFDEKFKLAWKATVGDLRDGDKFQYTATGEKWPVKYTDDELNAMCDAAEEKHSKHYYDYTRNDPNRENPFTTETGTVAQNGVTHTEYLKAKIEANSAWNDGWTNEYYQKIVDKYEGKKEEKTLNYDEAIAAGWTMTDDGIWWPPQDKKKWVLPVEEVKDADTDETEYFVSFPQDLLEAAKLKEGDEINWVDNGDGSFKIVKVTKPLGSDEC